MNFSQALEALKRGNCVNRDGWNGRGMFLSIQWPDTRSRMTRPYIFMSTVTGDLIPWVASQSDLLSDDWQVSAPNVLGRVLGGYNECAAKEAAYAEQSQSRRHSSRDVADRISEVGRIA